MTRITLAAIAIALASVASAQQQPSPVEQRLGVTIGALIVENSRISIELDAARQTIAQLRAELEKAKQNTER